MRFLIHCLRRRDSFTLVELLTVMAIIAILAGLILSIAGYATKKGALARASAEIQALSAACESYKADNGGYPHQPLAKGGVIPAISGTGNNSNVPSDILYPVGSMANGNSQPGSQTNPTPYTNASLELYEALTGDLMCTGTSAAAGVTNYLTAMKPDMWGTNNPTEPVGYQGDNTVYFLSDPFGNSYGYSTACATTGTNGYNSTFDLWSTGGQSSAPACSKPSAQRAAQFSGGA